MGSSTLALLAGFTFLAVLALAIWDLINTRTAGTATGRERQYDGIVNDLAAPERYGSMPGGATLAPRAPRS